MHVIVSSYAAGAVKRSPGVCPKTERKVNQVGKGYFRYTYIVYGQQSSLWIMDYVDLVKLGTKQCREIEL